MKHDAPYYDLYPGVVCMQDIFETESMGWNQCNILKAAKRWGAKGGSSSLEYDLEKILYFTHRQLSMLRSKSRPTSDTPSTEEVRVDMPDMQGGRSK